MKSTTTMLAASAAVACVFLSAAAAARTESTAPAASETQVCQDLAKVPLAHAKVVATAVVSAGQVKACRVLVNSSPTPDSIIGIEIWIPLDAAWNGKFVQIGNGGYAGAIYSDQLKGLAAKGYVAAGTDDGHQTSSVLRSDWALGHPQKLIDFGWRALKETTEVSKALTLAAKQRKPDRSYLSGCSDGGREGLMEAQRFPDDFDGIVVGAPGNYMARLMTMRVGYYQTVLRPGGYLDSSKLQLIQAAALADCGGSKLGYIQHPEACGFDPSKLRCKDGQSAGCLTDPELASIRAIYGGWRDPRTGALLFPGYEPGAEGAPAWKATILGDTAETLKRSSSGYLFAEGYLRNFAFQDSSFDPLSLDMGKQALDGVDRTAPIIDAEDPDLSRFKAHGGKLLQYHGWNDQNVPARSSLKYFAAVQKAMGDTSGFYRLFMVPGMLHCSGGAGPNTVDWLAELDRWVVGGKAPESLVATGRSAVAGAPPADGPSQLVCRYPNVARHVHGDELTAASYRCAAPN